jgi:hypothetical protein
MCLTLMKSEVSTISLDISFIIFHFIHFSVSVSVISIKGTDCKLVELGRIADITEGQVWTSFN